jgi:hypothetical protein
MKSKKFKLWKKEYEKEYEKLYPAEFAAFNDKILYEIYIMNK